MKIALSLLPGYQTSFSINHHIQWLRPDEINSPVWDENGISQWTVFRNPNPNDILHSNQIEIFF